MAERFLVGCGFRIMARGWRPTGWKRGEIDLIAERGGEIVFVEVKTRLGGIYGRPEEAVDWRKQRQLCFLAWSWMGENRMNERPYRIDVIAVTWDRGQPVVRHLVNAVEAAW